MMTALEPGTQYAADVAWVEDKIAHSLLLQKTKYEFYTLDGKLWVQVQGGKWESHAWHVVIGGYAMPSNVSGGVWRQMIIGARVHVEIIDDPRKRGESR
jgi:hypothetical protein